MAEDKKIQAGYTPLEPVDPDKYSVQQYLFDTNTILTRIERNLNLVIDLLAKQGQQEQNQRKVRTIGIGNRND